MTLSALYPLRQCCLYKGAPFWISQASLLPFTSAFRISKRSKFLIRSYWEACDISYNTSVDTEWQPNSKVSHYFKRKSSSFHFIQTLTLLLRACQSAPICHLYLSSCPRVDKKDNEQQSGSSCHWWGWHHTAAPEETFCRASPAWEMRRKEGLSKD